MPLPEHIELATQYEAELAFWKQRNKQADDLLLDEHRRLRQSDAALNRAMIYIRAERAFRNCHPSLRRANLHRQYQKALRALIDAGDIALDDAGRELESEAPAWS